MCVSTNLLLLIRTPVGVGSTPVSVTSSSLITSAKAPFPNKVVEPGARGEPQQNPVSFLPMTKLARLEN